MAHPEEKRQKRSRNWRAQMHIRKKAQKGATGKERKRMRIPGEAHQRWRDRLRVAWT